MKYLKLLQNLEKQQSKYSNISLSTAKIIYAIAKIRQPKKILEIGTSNGLSTITLAQIAPVVTIEKREDRILEAIKNFQKTKLKITILKGDALQLTKKLKGFDLVFIDATKSEYLQYLKNLKPKPRTIILADNILKPKPIKVQPYIDYVRKHHCSVLIPTDNGLELTII